MEATISGYGDGLIETPMAYCLPEKWRAGTSRPKNSEAPVT